MLKLLAAATIAGAAAMVVIVVQAVAAGEARAHNTVPRTLAATPNPTAGKRVFMSSGCGACHTFAAAGARGSIGPNLNKRPAADARRAGKPLKAFVRQSILKPNAFIAPGYRPGIMPSTYASSLSATELANLVAFLTARH